MLLPPSTKPILFIASSLASFPALDRAAVEIGFRSVYNGHFL